MSLSLTAFRCTCGKLHTAAFVSVTSRCTCDRLLWPQLNRPGGSA